MSIDELVSEAVKLPREQRKALIGRLLALGRGERDAAFRQKLVEKIDDNAPENWVAMADLPKHLRLDSGWE